MRRQFYRTSQPRPFSVLNLDSTIDELHFTSLTISRLWQPLLRLIFFINWEWAISVWKKSLLVILSSKLALPSANSSDNLNFNTKIYPNRCLWPQLISEFKILRKAIMFKVKRNLNEHWMWLFMARMKLICMMDWCKRSWWNVESLLMDAKEEVRDGRTENVLRCSEDSEWKRYAYNAYIADWARIAI